MRPATALRGARHRTPHRAGFHHSRAQERAQQRQQATVTDAFLAAIRRCRYIKVHSARRIRRPEGGGRDIQLARKWGSMTHTHARGPVAKGLLQRIERREVTVGVLGLGYVGLPLALAFAAEGVTALGYDIDPGKIDALIGGQSYVKTIASSRVTEAVQANTFVPIKDISLLSRADALLICVPTPLSEHREPDLSYVDSTAASLVPHLRKGQAIVLVSTTYPGTTDEVVRPHLAATNLVAGEDVFLIYAPEREDPGNQDFDTMSTPKVVGGENADALAIGCALFGLVIQKVVPVSSLATAEAVKLTENIFRAVNIALVNELKVLYDRMGIDTWEVIDAAKTKPFGYHAVLSGPRSRRALHSHRSVLPDLEGPRIRHRHPFHRAGRAKSTTPCRNMWCRNWRRRWMRAWASA